MGVVVGGGWVSVGLGWGSVGTTTTVFVIRATGSKAGWQAANTRTIKANDESLERIILLQGTHGARPE